MFDSELALEADGIRCWRLTRPLVWEGRRETFVVPTGFVTDFATVPRFLHWLVLPYGAYTRAAVLHDWLLVELAAWQRTHPLRGRETWDTSSPPASSRDIDGIFRAAMRDLGVSWAKRWTMWAAVRAASLFNPDRAYGRQFGKDAPAVLGIALATGPVILPGVVGVLISLGVVKLITWMSGGPPPARTARRGRPAGSHPKGH